MRGEVLAITGLQPTEGNRLPDSMHDLCPETCFLFEKKQLKRMVGAVRFELTTSCTRNKRASQATLRPEPRKTEWHVQPGIAKANIWLSAVGPDKRRAFLAFEM